MDNILYPEDPMVPQILALITYLNLPAVKQALHVGSHNWSMVGYEAYYALNADEQKVCMHICR
jgi:hypothetical protein